MCLHYSDASPEVKKIQNMHEDIWFEEGERGEKHSSLTRSFFAGSLLLRQSRLKLLISYSQSTFGAAKRLLQSVQQYSCTKINIYTGDRSVALRSISDP